MRQWIFVFFATLGLFRLSACVGSVETNTISLDLTLSIDTGSNYQSGPSTQLPGKVDAAAPANPPKTAGEKKDGSVSDGNKPNDMKNASQDGNKKVADASSKAADAAKPSSKVGQPCPCDSTTTCFEGICRFTCTSPMDPCSAQSNCPNKEACLALNGGSSGVCMPSLSPGAYCGPGYYCPANHTCAGVSGSSGSGYYQCLPLCNNVGATCGNGGTCLSIGMCAVCSKI
jgi:hypothetical protein